MTQTNNWFGKDITNADRSECPIGTTCKLFDNDFEAWFAKVEISGTPLPLFAFQIPYTYMFDDPTCCKYNVIFEFSSIPFDDATPVTSAPTYTYT